MVSLMSLTSYVDFPKSELYARIVNGQGPFTDSEYDTVVQLSSTWAQDVRIGSKYVDRDTLRISLYDNLQLSSTSIYTRQMDRLPFVFNDSYDCYILAPDNWTSMVGTPQYLIHHTLSWRSDTLRTIDGGPYHVFDAKFELTSPQLAINNIHKIFSSIDYRLTLNLSAYNAANNKINLLGLCLIKGDIQTVNININSYAKDAALSEILTKYVGTGKLLECQEELIDAGLGNFAKV